MSELSYRTTQTQTTSPSAGPLLAVDDAQSDGLDGDLSPDGAYAWQGVGGNNWVSSLLGGDGGSGALGVCRISEPFTAATDAAANEAQIAGAVAQASGALSYGLFDWAVTDEDAANAADALTALPPELQGQAVARMDATAFQRLLDNLTEKDKEKLASLVDSTHDPERKLKLWAELEKGRLAGDEHDAGRASIDRDLAQGLKQLGQNSLSEDDVQGIMANRQVSQLSALPPVDQEAAMAAMDDATFDALLSDTPEADREKFTALLNSTHDPERKLKLWAEAHKSQITNEAVADHKDEGSGPNRTADQLKNRDFNQQRDAIVDANNKEVDDEVTVAMAQLADGKLTETMVDDLIARKNKEAEIERKFNINMTNDVDLAANGTTNPETHRRTWTMTELTQVEGALNRMPPEHAVDNGALREIHRSEVRQDLQDDDTWASDVDTGADAGDGVITVYDTGAGYDPTTGTNAATDPWRTKKTSDLAGHQAGGTGNHAELSLIEEVLTHEAGHTVHQGDSALWTEWMNISGWEKIDEATLKTRLRADGMNRRGVNSEVSKLEGTREDSYDTRYKKESGNKVYRVDPYSDGYLGVNQGALPESADGNQTSTPEWDYAASNPEDHFAEVYAKAVHQPEALYDDLVAGPQAILHREEAWLADQQARLAALEASGAPRAKIREARSQIAAAQQTTDAARRSAQMTQAQWDFFRQKVFKTDDHDIQALTVPPGKEAVYQEYKDKAKMCQTPQQLDALRAEYRGRL